MPVVLEGCGAGEFPTVTTFSVHRGVHLTDCTLEKTIAQGVERSRLYNVTMGNGYMKYNACCVDLGADHAPDVK